MSGSTTLFRIQPDNIWYGKKMTKKGDILAQELTGENAKYSVVISTRLGSAYLVRFLLDPLPRLR